MSIQKIVQESLNKNPLGVKEAFEEELSNRVRVALEQKMADALEEAKDEDEEEDEEDEEEDEEDEEEDEEDEEDEDMDESFDLSDYTVEQACQK